MNNRKYRATTAILVILLLTIIGITANINAVQAAVINRMVKYRESKIRFVKPYDSQGKPVATERDNRRSTP